MTMDARTPSKRTNTHKYKSMLLHLSRLAGHLYEGNIHTKISQLDYTEIRCEMMLFKFKQHFMLFHIILFSERLGEGGRWKEA